MCTIAFIGQNIGRSVSEARQTSVIGPEGGVIELLRWKIKMTIPPGALDVKRVLSLAALRDPPEMGMQPNEILVSCGFQCDPSGVTFRHPVTITLPHCANISQSQDLTRAILYTDSDGMCM